MTAKAEVAAARECKNANKAWYAKVVVAVW